MAISANKGDIRYSTKHGAKPNTCALRLFDGELGFLAGYLIIPGCSENEPEKEPSPSTLKSLTAQNEV